MFDGALIHVLWIALGIAVVLVVGAFLVGAGQGIAEGASPHASRIARGLSFLMSSGPLTREQGHVLLGACHVTCRVTLVLGIGVAGAPYFVIDAKDSLIQGVAIAVGVVWSCVFALCYLRMRRSLARGGFAPDFMRKS
jgi:hypothetical protein